MQGEFYDRKNSENVEFYSRKEKPNIKIGESTKVDVTPTQIFVWVQ